MVKPKPACLQYKPLELPVQGTLEDTCMLCGQASLVKYTVAGRLVLPRPCNCWECDDCRPHRLKRLIVEALGGEPTIFLTLTWRVRPGWTPAAAAAAQSGAWAEYAAWYNRRHGDRALQYFAVREPTDAGWPHLHILVRASWVPHHELSDFMAIAIGSPIVKVESLKQVRSAVYYVSKYIAKGPHRFGTLKRYWRTLAYLLPAFLEARTARRESGVWQIDDRSWCEIRFGAICRNFMVEDLNPGVFIRARAPP